MPELELKSRKDRRKESRVSKKRRRRPQPSSVPPVETKPPPTKKQKKEPREKNLRTKQSSINETAACIDPYAGLNPDVVAAMKRDDEEIASLEVKLGIRKDKKKLHKEYARLEGYGDDFGSFLDGLDILLNATGKEYRNADDPVDNSSEDSFDDDSSVDDELVPMKERGLGDLSEDGSVLNGVEAQQRGGASGESDDGSESGSDEDDSDNYDANKEEELPTMATKGEVYRPSAGEDIYGRAVDDSGPKPEIEAYVPPHLRMKLDAQSMSQDEDDHETRRRVRVALNGAFNRLSNDTIIPTAKNIAQLYSIHPTSIINETIWKATQTSCVSTSQLMTGLVPVFVGALSGAHIEVASKAHLAEYVMEMIVSSLFDRLKEVRAPVDASDENMEALSKEPSNLFLLLCYLYNFGVVHCSLMYDIIKDLIQSFSEIDNELLLLCLVHCGRSLRSDDPTSLREIILLVQQRSKREEIMSSRVEYMISAMIDLKNNRRQKKDMVHDEKTARLRKALGTIKSRVASTKYAFKVSDSSLRISLSDILEADQKGRWWRVGASWAGKQHVAESEAATPKTSDVQDEKLLKLAAKYRMNSDLKRAIFCIIMAAADCDDAFEKLVKAGFLKNKAERDTVRVIMECCSQEKSYNRYYCHLVQRICDYRPDSKFTLQLAFWDYFKVLNNMKLRKAANLAKLLYDLAVENRLLKLSVLKPVDLAAPEEMSETSTVFFTIFLSSVLEKFEDPSDCRIFFEKSIPRKKIQVNDEIVGSEEGGHVDESEVIRAGLTVFFMDVLKQSPKYKKGSRFRANLKVAIKTCDPDNFF